MQLLILVLIAGVAGYFLAGSRFRKPIDDAADRVANTSRDVADRVEDGVRGTFRRRKKPAATIIDGDAVDAPPAEKQRSRRQSETDTGTRTE